MSRRIPILIACLDLAWLLGVLAVLGKMRFVLHGPAVADFYRLLALATAGFWIAVFQISGLDCLDGGWRAHRVLSRMALGLIALVAFVTGFALLARVHGPVLLLVYFAAAACTGLLVNRLLVYSFLRAQRRRGKSRRIVIMGGERFIREFMAKILGHPELRYEVVGTLQAARGGEPAASASLPSSLLGLSTEDALKAFRARHVDELIFLLDEPIGFELQSLIAKCQSMGIQVSVLPHGYELYTSKPRLTKIDGFPLVSFEQHAMGPASVFAKRLMDLIIAVLLLPLASAIVAASALVIFAKGHRIFRRELRVGKNGKAFWMYRLDVSDSELNVPTYERSLLNLSLSEVPQLWNVLRGEMSLVGPRPESPNRVRSYSEWQQQRLKAKPGMTGLAQVNGLRDRHASEEKTRYDLQYMLDWTPFLDIVLMVRTLSAVAKRITPSRSSKKLPVAVDRPAFVAREPVGEVVHVDRA